MSVHDPQRPAGGGRARTSDERDERSQELLADELSTEISGELSVDTIGNVDGLLRARADIEDSLQRYRRFSVVLFTDIAGSTAYFTRHGDLAGRMLVQRHDDLLFPIVESHGGHVVKTTGDGLLASFDDAGQACFAAVAMQTTLAAANRGESPDDALRIRVAMHAGIGFHDRNDIYGNLVNIAARVEKLAGRDQILLTGAVYKDLDGGLSDYARLAGEHALKGLDEPLRVYELSWREIDQAALQAVVEHARPVTILAAEVADSALLWERAPAAMRALHDRYEDIVREVVSGHGGEVFKVVGDAVSAAFPSPRAALTAAAAIQRAIGSEPWRDLGAPEAGLRVIIGVHTGPSELRGGVYVGRTVARATRLCSIGEAPQVLATGETEAGLRYGDGDGDGDGTGRGRERGAGDAGPPISLTDRGLQRLHGMRGSERVYELCSPGLPAPGRALRSATVLHPSHRVTIEDAPRGQAGVIALVPARKDTGSDSRGAASEALRPLWRLLRETVIDSSRTVSLSPAEARAIIKHQPVNLEEYWLGRVVEWSQPRYRIDTGFVQLSLLVDRGEESDQRWHQSDRRIDDLSDLFDAVSDPALVILAPPGSGKSTILRRIEVDVATAALRDGNERVSFFVQLNHYRAEPGDGLPDPAAWLAERWQARFPSLPPLSEYLDQGRVILLLDGLNEIPTASEADFQRCVRVWKEFVGDMAERGSGAWADGVGNRFVFSCRSLDYSAPLSSPSLRVPQVRIEPMSDRQIRRYLELYCPEQWADVWEDVALSPNLELLRTPYFLRLIVEQIQAAGRMPEGRAELFTGFVRHALRREIERDNPSFDGDVLLSSRDRRQIVRWRWKGAFDLPERGALVPRLGKLAYRMQVSPSVTTGAQVRVDVDDALDLIDHSDAERIVRAGAALSILDEDPATDEVLFIHQLVQEYFAGREMSRSLDPALVRVPWRAADVHPPLADTLSSLAPADPLPPLPTTGWEETALLAAVMAPDSDAFIRSLATTNLVLAGRCAAQREVSGRLSAPLREQLRRDLFARMRSPEADLRARVAAGLTLGHLGGPLYERREGPHGAYLMPDFVAVAAGVYRIGSDQPYEYRGRRFDEELPAGEVSLRGFAIGRFAVTNAEWACFMAGGGYDDEHFWATDEDKAWLHGAGTADSLRSVARYWRNRFIADPDLIHTEYTAGRMEWSNYELWQQRLRMNEESFERHLVAYYPARRETAPRHWNVAWFNNPMQPVIGVSCFEARAYARWLAEQSGLPIRLPSEAEWEAAARGREGRIYAYGDRFDPLLGNTLETHIRRPTPVGAFPDGDTPEGVADMTGNTFDYTSSLWGSDPFLPDWSYPYRADDGREAADAPVTVGRVVRGGSWYVGQIHSRCAYRGRDRYDLRPDDWHTYRGCRMAMDLNP